MTKNKAIPPVSIPPVPVSSVPGPHRFHKHILRQYDIRGVVGETLAAEDALAIGAAFGTIVAQSGGSRVCLGFDGRLSSPPMEAAVAEGLRTAGITVLRTGMGPTPMLYFAVHHLKSDGGIMITGSHNPPDHNGFKIMLGTHAFFGQDIQRLGEIAAAGDYAQGAGTLAARDVSPAYVDKLARAMTATRPMKVAWDAGNGAAGEIMARLTAHLPGQHVLLNQTIDGTFPNHHPDPTVAENLVQLQQTVKGEGCDFGIAFDGDGDRIGVVDGAGEILWGDQLMLIFAAEVLRHNPGATIIADVKASQVLFDRIAELGGTALMWRSGHSMIKSKMVETGAPLAGEMSGHIFFADHYFGFDDALYAAVRLLDILARADQSLAEIRRQMPAVVNTPELRFECADGRKFAVIDEVKARLAVTGADVNDVDGVRVTTADGWWLLRASNTQPVLVARCEAASDEGLKNLEAELREQLAQSGVEPPEF